MNTDKLIASYFRNSLSQEAKKEFDHLLATDSEFAKEVTFQKNLKTVIKKEEQDATKKQLQHFEAKENTITFNYKKWMVAAFVIVLLGVSSFWVFTNQSINTEQLYAEHFQPYRNVVQPIVRGETKTDLKTKAFTAYEQKKYAKALNYFNQLLAQKEDASISFYKANVLLQLNKTKKAIVILENNSQLPNKLKTQQQWYLALAYLKTDSIEEAKLILKDLDANSTFKNKSVKQLLKKLK